MSDKPDKSMRPDDHRRKWDSVEYEKNAQARLELEEAIEKSRERKDRLLRNRVLHLAKFACFVGCFRVLFEWVWSLFDWSIGRGEPGPERDKLKAREYKVDKMDNWTLTAFSDNKI